jgi:hypothetical protein
MLEHQRATKTRYSAKNAIPIIATRRTSWPDGISAQQLLGVEVQQAADVHQHLLFLAPMPP